MMRASDSDTEVSSDDTRTASRDDASPDLSGDLRPCVLAALGPRRATAPSMNPASNALAILVVVLASACGGTPGTGGESVGTSTEALVVCASGPTLKGVDVSTYQGSIDWNAAHGAGLDFAFARVSDGTTTPDGTFATNWAGIKAAGMVRGVYQFFRGSEDPIAQADLLVSAVGAFGAGDLPPVADVEVMDGVSGATLVANLATWVSEIKSKTGRTPMIYSSPGFWDALPSTGQFASELQWVANWGVSCPDSATPWTTWAFWQTADNGAIAGISGAVDLDEFNGTLAQLQGLGGPAPYAAQFVGQSFPLAATTMTMAAGETTPSYIELKNVGSQPWDSNTRIGTTQARDRPCVFSDASWLAPNRLAEVKGTVAPGATYKFMFDLHAPAKTGTYDEFFGVVEEGVAWFSDPGQGGPVDNDLEVKISVVAGPAGGTDAGPGASNDAGTTAPPGASSPGDDGGAGTAPGAGGPGVSSTGDGGGAVSNDAVSTHAGGCAVAHVPGSSSTWAPLAALLGAVSLRRRRTRRARGQKACLPA